MSPRAASRDIVRERRMALTGDRYIGEFEGHTVELVRNNWVKSLVLLIDGHEVDRTTCHFPGTRTLRGELVRNGIRHAVVAKSVPRYVLWTKDTIEIDGKALHLTKTK